MYTNTKFGKYAKELASLYKTRSRCPTNDANVVHLYVSLSYLTLLNTGICLDFNLSVFMLKMLILSDNRRFSRTYYTFLSIGSSMRVSCFYNGGR